MTILVNDSKLWTLLQSDENDELDFKSSDLLLNPDGSNRYKIAKHIVGFANHRGGKIIFGVDDDGIPEGADLVEEECLSTISEIVTERVSPTVDFSHTLYSADRDDLSEGAILVLNISEKVGPPPVAIIENSEGKIRKREYRIRSGESTRLVSDGELSALFNQDYELELQQELNFWYTHEEGFEAPDMHPKPLYFGSITPLYEKLSGENDELAEVLSDDDNSRPALKSEELFVRMVCLTILRFLYIIFSEEYPDEYSEENSEFAELDREDSAYDFQPVSPDEVVFEGDDCSTDEILKTTSIEFNELIEEQLESWGSFDRTPQLVAPEGSTISISDGFNKITIELEDHFTFEIEIRWLTSLSGYPKKHPQASGLGRNISLIVAPSMPPENPDDIPSVSSYEAELKFNLEFKYPMQTQREYVESREYCEHMMDRICSKFDWDSFIETIPEKKFYDIESQLDEIVEKLDSIHEGSMDG